MFNRERDSLLTVFGEIKFNRARLQFNEETTAVANRFSLTLNIMIVLDEPVVINKRGGRKQVKPPTILSAASWPRLQF